MVYKILFYMSLGVILMLLLRTCGKTCPETVKIEYDTVLVAANDSTSKIPEEPEIVIPPNKKTKFKQPQETEWRGSEYLTHADTVYITNDYLSTRYYVDTQRIADGYIVIKDSVTQNKIQSRLLVSNIPVREITKTITQTLPKRLEIYLGVTGAGSKLDVFYMAGLSLSVKTKSDKLFGASVMYSRDKVFFYQLNYQRKL